MLSPTLPTPDVTKIEKVFSEFRGNQAIWMDEKEKGYWEKVVVVNADSILTHLLSKSPVEN